MKSLVEIPGWALPRLCLCAIALACAGCTTTLAGRKASPDSEGLRYYLPAPHIYMAPQADGSLKAEVKYLRDPQNTYTLNLNAYFAKATFEVKTKDGMLDSVNLDSDTSEIAVSALAAATELRKARIAADEAQATARKAQETANAAAAAEAADAIGTQREELALLEGKRAFYVANPTASTAESRLQLDLDVSQARIKLEQLRRRLVRVRATDGTSFNDPGAADGGVAFGPALFRVLHAGEGVKLVALQEGQPTIRATVRSAAQPVTLPATSAASQPDRIVIKGDDAKRKFVLKFQMPVAIDADGTRLVRPAESAFEPAIPKEQIEFSIDASGKEVTVGLPGSLKPGSYRLDLAVRPAAGGERRQESFQISWLES